MLEHLPLIFRDMIGNVNIVEENKIILTVPGF